MWSWGWSHPLNKARDQEVQEGRGLRERGERVRVRVGVGVKTVKFSARGARRDVYPFVMSSVKKSLRIGPSSTYCSY